METFGDEEVDLVDCESGEFKEGTLKDILRLYDTRGSHDQVLKVKVRPRALPHQMDTLNHCRMVRTGHLKRLSEVENLPKSMRNLKIVYHFPV